MRLAAGMLAVVLVACGGSMAPVSSDAAGAWALETVDGHGLPHAYADTSGPVVSSGVVLADTLVLLESEDGERLTWLDDGGGPYRLRTPLLWSQPGGASGDSVTVTEIFRVGGVHHAGIVIGDRLTLRIELLVRPGTYVYARAPH
jgi:hypothetical protein